MAPEWNTGLVLSGGGARGFAHLGVLQALDELRIRVDVIAGSSAGAICGAFYLSGHTPVETLKQLRSYKLYDWMRFRWRKPGLLTLQKVASLLEKHLPGTFEELSRPLFVTATDILQCRTQFFSSGPLILPVCASASIPVVFEPLRIGDSVYVDGGILNNLPVEPLAGRVKTLIAVHVNPLDKTIGSVPFKDMADRAIHLAISPEIAAKKEQCDIFIEPQDCSRFGLFDLSAAEKLFETGYNAAMEMKQRLLAIR